MHEDFQRNGHSKEGQTAGRSRPDAAAPCTWGDARQKRNLIFQIEELPCEAANCRMRRRSKQVSIEALLAFESQ
jgi:hypothetical protein